MTERIYYDQMNLLECNAKIVEIQNNYLILDRTVFHAQGGGQPCDTGIIENENAKFIVEDVKVSDDKIIHYGHFENGSFNVNDKVNLKVDKERRLLNSRLHSASHILHVALEEMNSELNRAGKGYHFPDSPWVEYIGVPKNNEELKQKLQEKLDEMKDKDMEPEIAITTKDELHKYGLKDLPFEKIRLISFKEGEWVPCSGTHINMNKIGRIIIKTVKSKESKTKIYYDVE